METYVTYRINEINFIMVLTVSFAMLFNNSTKRTGSRTSRYYLEVEDADFPRTSNIISSQVVWYIISSQLT